VKRINELGTALAINSNWSTERASVASYCYPCSLVNRFLSLNNLRIADILSHFAPTFFQYVTNAENQMSVTSKSTLIIPNNFTCWRNLTPTSADRGVSRGQRGGSPTVVNFSFLDQIRYFSFK
jgi:hypothetical protein